MPDRFIGKSIPRKEGREKVTGRATYIDDIAMPDMLHGVTVRSPVARGRLRGIRFAKGIPWDEFTIVTAKDIPGKNCVALILDDQPCLADQVVNHAEEPVVLLAHADQYLLEEARRSVELDIEPLPPVFTIDESLAKQQVIWGEDNIFKSFLVESGDVESAWSRAHLIIEGEYETGAQEQLYIEPQGMIANLRRGAGLDRVGLDAVSVLRAPRADDLAGFASQQVRVIQTETGGGFGGKEEYPSMIAGHAALLAWKSGKPVKIVYDRMEDMAATTKRHPSRTRHRTAVTREGKLLAMDIEFVVDGGAYATLSPVVLSRGTIHAAGRTSVPTCAFAAKPWPPTSRRTERFAASALRRVSSRWSARWTRSPGRSASPRRNFAAATSSKKARRWRSGRWCGRRLTWPR